MKGLLAVSSLLGIIKSVHSSRGNWNANPRRKTVSRTPYSMSELPSSKGLNDSALISAFTMKFVSAKSTHGFMSYYKVLLFSEVLRVILASVMARA